MIKVEMAEQKKDMTALMEYAKAMQDSGSALPPPPGSVMEEQKLDKVENFESLEDFSKAHPAAEPPQAPADPSGDFPVSSPDAEAGAQMESPVFSDSSDMPQENAFATTPAELPTGLEGLQGTGNPSTLSTLGLSAMPGPVLSNPESTFAPGGDDLSAIQMDSQAQGNAPPPEFGNEQNVSSSHVAEEVSRIPAPEPELREPLRPATKTPPAPRQPLEMVQHYSEQLSPGRNSVPASFPFSLLITGELAPEEKERLTDLLSRENMGIRELDLEPQFESGKILIPRISEYAGVMIISALRSTRARMRLGPSDSIFATADTQDSLEEVGDSNEHESDSYTPGTQHPAEKLPITTDTHFPGHVHHAVLDIVTASAALKSMVVQTESSPEYQTLLDALQRELKFKAFRKGATAIINFSVHLQQLHMPMHYRVMVTGSAIKRAN